MMKYSLSVVVPIYNDEEVIDELMRRLSAVLESIAKESFVGGDEREAGAVQAPAHRSFES